VCPYHRWTYELDGALFAAGRMDEGFDKREHGLRPVALRRSAGGIFICLADNPPEFDSFGARFAEYAGPLGFENLKLAATDTLVENANWKLVMENARECYHCPTGHPDLATSFPVHFSRHFDAMRNPAAPEFEARMDELGLPHASIEGSWWQLARFALNPGCSSISMDGQPVSAKPLTTLNDGNVGSLRWAIEPHLFAHATGDHVFLFSCMPVAPRETHVFSRWYVHKDAVEGVDYNLPDLMELWLKTNAQDKQLAENNHRGVVSPGYVPGPYSPDAEALVVRFTDWYCDRAKEYLDAHG
jgi:Rieske 2Fe-2S family protein